MSEFIKAYWFVALAIFTFAAATTLHFFEGRIPLKLKVGALKAYLFAFAAFVSVVVPATSDDPFKFEVAIFILIPWVMVYFALREFRVCGSCNKLLFSMPPGSKFCPYCRGEVLPIISAIKLPLSNNSFKADK